MDNILISISGGKTSAFMSIYMKELYKDKNLLFVYANTGKEREETLTFLHNIETQFEIPIVWVEADVIHEKGKGTKYKVVDYNSASRNGDPFREVVKKYGLPSKLYRHCTREMKEQPIHKYAKDYFKGENYKTAIGIRADEKHRLTSDPMKIYPLSDMNITKKFINEWWEKQSFNLHLHPHQGNCDFCFLKSKKKRVKLLREGLDVSFWQELEDKYSSDWQPMFDVRSNLTINDLVQIAKDESKQLSLLDDVSFDCYCKNS